MSSFFRDAVYACADAALDRSLTAAQATAVVGCLCAIDYAEQDDTAYDALCAVAGEQVRRLETTADVDGFLAGLSCAAEADV